MSRAETASAQEVAPLFAALGDATRLQLVQRLCGSDTCSIVQLADGLALTRQGVTKHLLVLENAGLVSSTKSGRENRFALAPGALRQMQAYLDYVSAHWDEALGRLQLFVENQPD